MTHEIQRLIAQRIASKGWRLGTTLENSAAHRMDLAGLRSQDCKQQYHVGRYRLDFAWPQIRVAIEVDGWQHQRPATAAKDAERDAWLRGREWIVLRADDRDGEDAFDIQIHRAIYVVNALLDGPRQYDDEWRLERAVRRARRDRKAWRAIETELQVSRRDYPDIP